LIGINKNKVYFIGQEDLYSKEESPLYEHKSIEDLIQWISERDSIALDTETEGFFNHANRIIMLQLSDGNDIWVIDVRNNKDCFIKLKPYLESKLIIGQNLKFDYKFLKLEGIILDKIYDTFLAECCLTNGKEWLLPNGKMGRQLGLGEIAKRYLGVSLDKSVRNQFIGLNGQPFTYKQIVYGSEDVLYLHKIKELQTLRANKYELNEYISLENQACLALADIEYNGMGFNIEAWLKLSRKVDQLIPLHEKELDDLVRAEPKLTKFINKTPQLDLFGGTDRDVTILWSSPAQVLAVLKGLIGDEVESSSEKDIAIYQYSFPLVKKLIDYKKDAKLASTYGDNFINFINPVTKRIHGEFWQILNTSRVSCGGSKSGKSSVNLQNLPAKNDYLNCFVADKGKLIIGIDYKGKRKMIILLIPIVNMINIYYICI